MKVRAMRDDDRDALNALYDRSPFNFDWPEFESGRFEEILVVEEDGVICGMLAAVRTAELYMLVEGSPMQKYEAVEQLHVAALDSLRKRNVNKGIARLQPSVAKRFGQRLMKEFGWKSETFLVGR